MTNSTLEIPLKNRQTIGYFLTFFCLGSVIASLGPALPTLAAKLGVGIGQIGGGKRKPTGQIDVAMIQSLVRKGEVTDEVGGYGHVIVDECHHVSAFSFEQVLKQVRARYVLGLTATPIRKDGHHPIIAMQCGPVRFRVRAKAEAAARPFDHLVVPRPTEFRMAEGREDAAIQEIYSSLASDE